MHAQHLNIVPRNVGGISRIGTVCGHYGACSDHAHVTSSTHDTIIRHSLQIRRMYSKYHRTRWSSGHTLKIKCGCTCVETTIRSKCASAGSHSASSSSFGSALPTFHVVQRTKMGGAAPSAPAIVTEHGAYTRMLFVPIAVKVSGPLPEKNVRLTNSNHVNTRPCSNVRRVPVRVVQLQ